VISQWLFVDQGDALKFDLSTLTTPLRVVGNLPYNISSPLLFHLLENRDKVMDMTFMLQKEVVERMVAENGSKTYGRLSVMMQAFFEVELIFTVPPESFEPKSSTLSISARCDKSMVVCCCNSKDFKQFPRVFLR
jgi:16S rRNA (adenine1518-N6/adenine1519-N6)-dimethyltransferase